MNTIATFRKSGVVALALVVLAFAFSTGSAQPVSSYSLTTFSGEYISIANNDVSSSFLPGADDATQSLSLPFDLTYDGSVVTAGTPFVFSSNGFLAIGSNPGAVPDFNNWGVADNVSTCILPFSGDLVLNDDNSSGNSYAGFFEVTGIAPNRVATFEWQDFIIYSYDGFTSGGMQVKIYETTNVIEFLYNNPGYAFSGDILPGLGTFNDPCAFSVGLNGNPYSSDNNLYTTSASALPSTDLRFTPSIIQNIQLSVQPKNLSFGQVQAGTPSAQQCVSVQNAGTSGTLNITSASITGSSDFVIVSSPETNTYNVDDPAGQYCIVFTPTSSGLRSATLTIASNGKDSGLQTVSLTGSGALADYTIDSLIRFKNTRTRLGDSLTQYLHITSTGQAPLFFSSFTLSGFDAGQYYVSYFPVSPLPPGQRDSIGITYVPTLEGKHIATLTLSSNSFLHPSVDISLQGTGTLPRIVVTPALLLFDSTKEGDTVCKTIDIWNPGTDTLKILSNSLTSNDGDFHYIGITGENNLIPPNQHRIVTVCFIPLQRGIRQARLLLKTNITKTFDTPRRDTAGFVTIEIRGTGVPFGVFGNSVNGLPFVDSALVGATVCRIDTLKNNGDGDILVTSLAIAGLGNTPASDFSYSGLHPLPFLLKTRSSVTFTICGTPDKQGLLSGTATVSGTTGGSKITVVLPLFVYGFLPCIAPSPITLFAGVTLPNNGSDSTLCDTITNCGDIAAVYQATISGTSAADYSVTPAISGTVAPHGGTTVFCVKYKPSAVGASPASLDVTASDNSASVKVPLSGADGCAVLTHVAPNIPNTGDNEKRQFTFTISNTGTFAWTPGTPSITGTGAGSFIVDSIVPQPIPAGGQATVYMTFHPPLGSQGQTLTANIAWPNGGPCGDSLSVDLNGESIQSSVNETASSDGFVLEQTYPNPTQGKATFNFTTPRETQVRIALVDLTGRLIRTLITGRVSEGQHSVNFDARDLPSGTYVYMLESGSIRLVRQLILTR